MNPADEMAANVILPTERRLAGAAAGSGEKSDPQLRAILENLEGVARQDDRHSGKRRRSRGFVRFLVAICIGVGGTLAWQSYGEAIKQIIATRAPELGRSPEAKQTIASSIQWLGWTRQHLRRGGWANRHPRPTQKPAPRNLPRQKPPPLPPSTRRGCRRWCRISQRCGKWSSSSLPVKTRRRVRSPSWNPPSWKY